MLLESRQDFAAEVQEVASGLPLVSFLTAAWAKVRLTYDYVCQPVSPSADLARAVD